MTDYGVHYNTHQIISGSTYLFRSGTLADSSTAISASSNQVIAITCSANYNNRLTKLTSVNANATITITSGSSDRENIQNDTKLILRYFSGSQLPTDRIVSSSESTIDHLLGGIGTNITFIDIPLLNDDDSFSVAYKTVRALTASVGHNRTFKAALVDDGSTFEPSSSLGENMSIGSSFRIRSAPTYTLPNDYLLSSSGFFTITSLNSGSVATPDFSGTEVQIDGMQLGTSFMVGGGSGSQAFAHNLIQTGSGFLNQSFFQGYMITSSATIAMRLDPNDNTSGLITGSGGAKLYMSSSGRIGLGTTDPTTDVDIKGDEITFRRKAEDVGVKMNDEGNLESFTNLAGKATTGSELILNYTRGTKAIPVKPNINDIMGSVRWISNYEGEAAIGASFKRTGGEVASIATKVASVAENGVAGDMVFSVATSSIKSPTEMLRIGANGIVSITGSLVVTQAITSSIVSSSILYIQHITASHNISASGDLFIKGNITGSNISSSGDIIGKDLTASGDIFGEGSASFGTLTIAPSSSFTVEGSISASGNIWSNNHEILTAQSFKYVDLDDEYYGFPGNSGIAASTWGFQKTNGPNGVGDGSQHIGIVLPFQAILVGVIGQFRASIGGNTSWDDSGGGPFNFALWTCLVADGESQTSTTWVETIKTADLSIGADKSNFTYNFQKLDGTTILTKGTSIIPSFLNESGVDNVDIFGNYTILIKRT